jgi:hypothetical protein
VFKKMLDKLTGGKSAAEVPAANPKTEALFRAIDAKRAEDPPIGAKIGSREITQRLLAGFKSESGVHIESLLCALGALAGYSCQANLRAQARAKGMPETAPFINLKTKDGRQYLYGDPLNEALAESQYSVWGLAAGAAQHAGCKALPDIKEIFSHVTGVIGDGAFGVPRVPENHRASDTPLDYLTAFWPVLFPMVQRFCPNPVDWPILFSVSVQEVTDMGKDVIDPCLALTIVMESAVPMSKFDLPQA